MIKTDSERTIRIEFMKYYSSVAKLEEENAENLVNKITGKRGYGTLFRCFNQVNNFKTKNHSVFSQNRFCFHYFDSEIWVFHFFSRKVALFKVSFKRDKNACHDEFSWSLFLFCFFFRFPRLFKLFITFWCGYSMISFIYSSPLNHFQSLFLIYYILLFLKY
jgi:hypothetical protein